MKSFKDWSVSSFIRADRWIASEQMPGHTYAAANNAARLVASFDQLPLSAERKFMCAANALARMQTVRGVETMAAYAESLMEESGSKSKLARRGLYFLSAFAPQGKQEGELAAVRDRFEAKLRTRLVPVTALSARRPQRLPMNDGETLAVLVAS